MAEVFEVSEPSVEPTHWHVWTYPRPNPNEFTNSIEQQEVLERFQVLGDLLNREPGVRVTSDGWFTLDVIIWNNQIGAHSIYLFVISEQVSVQPSQWGNFVFDLWHRWRNQKELVQKILEKLRTISAKSWNHKNNKIAIHATTTKELGGVQLW